MGVAVRGEMHHGGGKVRENLKNFVFKLHLAGLESML